MTKVKFLSILAVGLFILNIALLIFIFTHKPPHPHHKDSIKKMLQFDAEQTQLYENLIEQHRKKTKAASVGMRDTRRAMYQLLSKEIDKTVRDSLVKEVGNFQKNLENAHLEHFMEIKKICRADQLDNFAKLTLELERLFSHKSQRPKKRKIE